MPKSPKKAEPVITSDYVRQFGTIERVDPDEDFSDVDGDPKNDFALVDEASDRQYVWAHNSRDGIGDYAGGVVPYRVEHYEDGGVKARMNAEQTKGELIEKKGHVLMSCDKELWQKRNRYERVETLRTNETMFKRRQRTLDLRQPEAVRAERESLRG